MVTKDQHIPLIPVKLVENQPGYLSIYFTRPIDFTFEAGDWVDIQFEGRELKGGITYSLSSSPTESDLRISFREGISEFKKALQTVSTDNALFISQYGNDYGFQLKKNQLSVLIAGGIGIAPFRSMLKEMYDTGATGDVTLIYLNQNDQFLFKAELDMWAAALPNLTVHYISTKILTAKSAKSWFCR